MKKFLLVLCIFFSLSGFVDAQKYGSGGSRSSSPSSSSRPSSSSSRPSSSFSKSPASKPSSVSKPSTSKPSSSFKSSPPPATTSQKPVSKPSQISDMAKSNKQESSKVKMQAAQKTTTPAPTYKAPPVNKTVSTIKSAPKSTYTPEARTNRYTTVVNNNYSHPYSYYQSQPYFNVGGGYSPVFWWMMMEWSADRRAAWMYHNQHNITQEAYLQGTKDAAVQAELARLRSSGTPVDTGYVDKDFVANPDLMYTDSHIKAITGESTMWWLCKWVLTLSAASIIIGGLSYSVFFWRP